MGLAFRLAAVAVILWQGRVVARAGEPPRLAMDVPAGATFHFSGRLGERIDANRRHWLVPAPSANPGMLGMFHQRDRKPVPNLVPWAGEFVGKYLLSAVQALRMSDDPDLKRTTKAVVEELLASQAKDGYLGPFPRDSRLRGNWDLWGHYHVMMALLAWHEQTGDARALTACRRAADLICTTYLNSGHRVFDAGSHEMNMAVLHVLVELHRRTGEPRYLAMAREIEKDWQRAGDYLRAGLAGVEFFRTPRPRWESLHDLQGLAALFADTGDERYRRAFLHHWQSIRRWDRRNTGAFSSGEQATGNPFAPTPIETCCTIAWMALSIDALRLSGDARAADELELSTFNAVAGAQHPSGRWWTYSTPMDGVREASAHAIVFQARAGAPELNCCAVNGPRGLGMLSEWAVMSGKDTVVVNYYGPMRATLPLAGGTRLVVSEETRYPLENSVNLTVNPSRPVKLRLRLRIPSWSAATRVEVAGHEVRPVRAGSYVDVERTWKAGDVVRLTFDFRLRREGGDQEAHDRVSLYRGPLLLAYDQRFNAFDEDALPSLASELPAKPRIVQATVGGVHPPWLLVEVPAAGGKVIRLCDFASAGSAGTHYRSWLPSAVVPPAAPPLGQPADGAVLRRGRLVFTTRQPAPKVAADSTLTLLIAESPDMTSPVLRFKGPAAGRLVLPRERAERLSAGRDYYWTLVARNQHGQASDPGPPKRFRINAR
jgi:hypothetical protein